MKTTALLLLGCLSACTSPETRAVEPVTRAGEGQFRMIPLQFAAAQEVVGELQRLWPETRVACDARTNSVLLTCATEAELKQLTELVAQLDVQVKGSQ
jgi:type II/III secretion system protein